MRKLREEVPAEVIKTAYYGLFHSRMVYGIELWGGISEASIVFKLQKRAIRTMMKKRARVSCRPLFKELNILTLPSVFILKQALYKKKEPSIETRGDKHNHDLRNKDDICIPYKRLVMSNQLCSVMSARVFNKIPLSVRRLSENHFKRTITRFLMRNCFYDIKEFINAEWSDEHFKQD